MKRNKEGVWVDYEGDPIDFQAELDKFGVKMEDVAEFQRKQDVEGDVHNDRRICVCGHAMNKHTPNNLGAPQCKPNIHYCHCMVGFPVLGTTDRRKFLHVSKGNGSKHALTMGVRRIMETGGGFTWLKVNYKCYKCGTDEGLLPVICTLDGYTASVEKGKILNRGDLLLCENCNFKFQSSGTLGSF